MAERIDADDISWVGRLRSAVLLVLLAVVLGAVGAAITGLLLVGLTALVDQALG